MSSNYSQDTLVEQPAIALFVAGVARLRFFNLKLNSGEFCYDTY